MKDGIKKILGLFVSAIVALFLLQDCSTLFGDGGKDNTQIDGVVVERSSKAIQCVGFDFSEDYRYIDIDIEFSDSLSKKIFTSDIYIDSVAVSEKLKRNGGYKERWLKPQLISSEEEHNRDFDNIHSLVIVDLSLPQDMVDAQRDVVTKIDRATKNDNLHVVFSGGGELSAQYPVTKYLLDNNFVSKGEQNYLLRDIVNMNERMLHDTRVRYGVSSWSAIPNSKKVMFVLSDGQLYDNGVPVDPDHYDLQQELYNIGAKAMRQDGTQQKSQFPIHYINFNTSDSLAQTSLYTSTKMRLESLCSMTGGTYFKSYVYEDFFDTVSSKIENVERLRYSLRLENPHGKIYLGEPNELIIDFYVGGVSYVHSTFNYSIGMWVDPIIIGVTPDWVVASLGLINMLLLVFFVYIVMQIVYPYLSYLWFKYRYVVTYRDEPQIYNNAVIEEECCYCRDKFSEGDSVVVRCHHTMHLDCWEENGYKCPEYGEGCKDGSYYYNEYNLLDRANAPYQMWWTLGALGVAFMVWGNFVFLDFAGLDFIYQSVDRLFNSTIMLVNDSQFLDVYLYYEAASTRYLYIYGFELCFWLTLFLGVISTQGQPLVRRIVSRVLLALGSGVCGMFLFFIYGIVTTPIDVANDGVFVVSLLLLLVSVTISVFSSIDTKVGWLRVVKGVGLTLVVSILLLVLIDFPERKIFLSEYLQLVFNCVYCVGFALTFSHVVPPSRRYFLRMSGAVKSTEIAIFKWFSSAKNSKYINIGRSRDCEIHMDWDLTTDISSTHATIENRGRGLYVMAHSEMLINGSKCVIGRRYRLYDMTTFVIGKSTFTYVEKD